jgi:ribosomal protein S6E (S10)
VIGRVLIVAQETVAALIGVGEEAEGEKAGAEEAVEVQGERLGAPGDLDGVPIFDDRPIDFSGGAGLDGMPMVHSVRSK